MTRTKRTIWPYLPLRLRVCLLILCSAGRFFAGGDAFCQESAAGEPPPVDSSMYQTDSAQDVTGPAVSGTDTVLPPEPATARMAPPAAGDNRGDIERLREDAAAVRSQAIQLYDQARESRRESRNIDDAIDDLEKKAGELEDQAAELLKQAGLLQTCIKLTREAETLTGRDSLAVGADSSAEPDLAQQKMLMLKMRNSADELLIKAKKISVRVREMKEGLDEKEGISDKLEYKAEALEKKAKELERMAERLEDERNVLPLSIRYPFQVGHQIRCTSVPPYNDRSPHILLLSGFNVSYTIKGTVTAGIEDICLRFAETVYGRRTAIAAAPFLSYSVFAARRFEFGAGAGAAIQGQVGGDTRYDVAVAPFVKLFNENRVSRRFSLGPVVALNFCAHGNLVTRSIPFDEPKVLPYKAWWLDCGISYAFHF